MKPREATRSCTYDLGVPYGSLALLSVALAGCGFAANAAESRQVQGSDYRGAIIHYFKTPNDGIDPNNGLAIDASGALYGSTFFGGVHGAGTVYKLTPAGPRYAESVIFSFGCASQGGAENPNAGLIADASGALYGTSFEPCQGKGYGVVFKLTPSGSNYVESTLHRFEGTPDGAYPNSMLVADQHGALYGTTYGGGNGLGTVFKLTPARQGYSERVVFRFKGTAGGYSPGGALIVDPDGAIYGTTRAGGTAAGSGCGVIFRLTPTPAGAIETVLHRFTGRPDGCAPSSGLVADGAGWLYGATTLGGRSRWCGAFGCGTLFRLMRTGSGYAVLYSFHPRPDDTHDGSGPTGNLLIDPNGALYGTTNMGGAHRAGAVFELAPTGSGYQESIVFSFRGEKHGAHPLGLTAGPPGIFYGATAGFGGPHGCGHGCGDVFELTQGDDR